MSCGILLVDKPENFSSMALDRRVKKLFSEKKLGHCGTLDPFATGLLPLALGRATAVVRYMDGYDKSYAVRCRLGRATDSLDRCGATTLCAGLDAAGASLFLANEAEKLRRAVLSLGGPHEQVPPLFSAVKLQGKRLYEYAHKGLAAPSAPARSIVVHRIAFTGAGWDAEGDAEAGLFVDFELCCSKGTYVRTLCEELGIRLGLPAYAERLRRTSSGPYKLSDAHSLERLEALAGDAEQLESLLLPMETALSAFPVLEFSLLDIDALLCGRCVPAENYLEPRCLTQASEQRFLIRGERGVAGVCLTRLDSTGHLWLKVERMFTDRVTYFA